MKFCPQCGTTFEPEARFCLECGFDRSMVETAATTIPEAAATEKTVSETSAAEETVLHSEAIHNCPQCGGFLDTSERFCPECGFDTSISKPPETKDSPVISQSEEMISPVVPTEQPADFAVNTQICRQCGSGIANDERFCAQCGFDTFTGNTVDLIEPEPVIIPPIVVTPLPSKPVIPPPVPKPVIKETPSNSSSANAPIQAKGKKTVLRIVLAIIILGVLATAGWFVYNNYLSSTDETTEDSVITMGIPENQVTEEVVAADEANTEETEPSEDAANNTASNTKSMSRIDQELAKHKGKGQTQASQQNITNQNADESTKTAANEIVSKIIFEVGRKEEPKNKNPKNASKLTIRKATMITRITTDHYNDGMGTPRGGVITIKDSNGNVKGSFKALGKTGKNGTPSAKWVAEPNIMLEKGTYFIVDSDVATWSKTFLGNNGFIVIEGYEIE